MCLSKKPSPQDNCNHWRHRHDHSTETSFCHENHWLVLALLAIKPTNKKAKPTTQSQIEGGNVQAKNPETTSKPMSQMRIARFLSVKSSLMRTRLPEDLKRDVVAPMASAFIVVLKHHVNR
jgi:hypothetical protein